ncbi:hypothetical protein AB0C95_04660 [Streptomyces caniferus]|uniref:hypothetical protein n=1 Tax=Streptomyces caniferus TaxID=285557 RepID=UPI0033E7F71E
MAITKQTFDFPQDLLDAQLELHRVRAELSAVYEQLPWSAEPLPGWTHAKENGRAFASSRPDSPGYTDEEKKLVEELRARRLELATTVFTHPFWATCDDAVTARSALKHTHKDEAAGSAPA